MKVTMLLIVATIFVAAPVAAQTACAPRGEMLELFSKEYGEEPVGRGLTSNGVILEVLSSDDGTTFTVIITPPDGTSCLVATGEHWETVLKKKKGEKI